MVDAVSGAGLVVALVAGVIAVVVAGLGILVFRLADLMDYASEHTIFFIVAGLLVASAVVLLRVVAVASTRRG